MDDYLSKPVRPEDVRAVVERWASTAALPKMPEANAPAATIIAAAAGDADSPADEIPPVDMERLIDFTDGNQDNLRELVTLYINQTSEQVEQLGVAVQTNQTMEVRRLAHSCAGASATCGMARIVAPLRELEMQGNDGKLTGADALMKKVIHEFGLIRKCLEPYTIRSTSLASHSSK